MPERKQDALELCLCTPCASVFYNMPSKRIVRKDFYQIDKEPCTYCSRRMGYDFLIFEKSSVQKRKIGQMRTLESEAGNE
jgi:hypothetical protein